MKNLFQRLRNLFPRRQEENGYHYGQEGAYEDQPLSPDGDDRQLFTALDIGTAFAKAIIVEIHDDQATVLGVGRYQQSYTHMSDGIVTDISGVIANCNEALIRAEKSAGGVVAPSAVIGIAGELVKGSSITVKNSDSSPRSPSLPKSWKA